MRSFHLRLEKRPPVGLVHRVVEPDGAVLLVRGSLTTEDGESLYQAVASLTSDPIGKELLQRRMVLDEVACVVAVCDPDGLDVHVNPPVMLRVASKKTVEKGEMALIPTGRHTGYAHRPHAAQTRPALDGAVRALAQ